MQLPTTPCGQIIRLYLIDACVDSIPQNQGSFHFIFQFRNKFVVDSILKIYISNVIFHFQDCALLQQKLNIDGDTIRQIYLDKDTICCYAGLASIPKFGCHAAPNSQGKICRVKYYKRSITSQLQRQLLDRACALFI